MTETTGQTAEGGASDGGAGEDAPTAAGATVLTGGEAPPPEPADPKARELVEEAAEHRRPVPEGGEHGAHPTDAQYIKIALILAVITAGEVGISYARGLGDAAAPLLLILAAVKFFIVVAFFMHLRFDTRVLRRLFVTGIVLACSIYVVVFLLLGVFTTTHGAHA
ncbi:MAG TPA: cytochrome C oxidase subunit IV family protein [Acidimicrobiales bacterium]|jgi:cytochrome c oxidase subunit 4|nr:cytochrome C oxidase subunit IV family protein [Acidimicrobiales bacterium]